MEKRALDLSGLADSAVRQALSEIGDISQIRERPFEILLRYVWPGLRFLRGKWLSAIVLGVADKVLGIGPGALGAWLDRAIGKGPGSGSKAVSAPSLLAASQGVVDSIIGSVFSRSSALRAEFARRGVVDARALVVAWAHGPDPIEKRAQGRLATRFRSWLAMSPNSRGMLSGALYSLLKALLVGLGIQTGAAVLFGGGAKAFPAGGRPGIPGPAPAPIRSPGMRLYDNPAGDVERSLVAALDSLVRDRGGRPFSELFAALKGYPPAGSPEMAWVLAEVRAAHGGAAIREIDSQRTFAAPPLAEIAGMLLPQATYTRRTTPSAPPAPTPPSPDAERELEGILGGKR
jgi:hypothetical protein